MNELKILAVGLMSGTSLDGVDAALVELESSRAKTKVTLKHAVSIPYEQTVRELLLAVCDVRTATVEQICQLNAYVAIHFANVVETLLDEAGVRTEEISFISSHGQTIYHIPKETGDASWDVAATLQIGDISYLSERTGLPVVGDFRPADMAAGGQGAPLVSFVDYLLFTHEEKNRVAQNIGGIGNVTFLQADGKEENVISFDTGPGNMVIDALMRKVTNEEKTFDQDGSLANIGTVDERLLDELMKHPYLSMSYPKTTGREDFGEQFVERIWVQALDMKIPHEDLIATVTEWTAKTIAESYREIEKREHVALDEAIISGGGAYNVYLLSRIQAYVPHIQVITSNEVGIHSDQKEAIAFALLGNECIRGMHNTLPSATGALHPVIMGKIAYTQQEAYEKIVQLMKSE